MFDRLLIFFLSKPGRISLLGAFMTRIGSFLLLIGLVGQVAVTAIESIKQLVPQAQTNVSITVADVLPEYLAMWIPEGGFGFGGALLLVAAGMTLVGMGKDYKRQLRA